VRDHITHVMWARAHPGGRGWRVAVPLKNPKPKFKKHGFCRYYDVKSFTWFTLQPKSATEVSWRLVH
jgi:hypothetical protein